MDIYSPFSKLCAFHAVFRKEGASRENATGHIPHAAFRGNKFDNRDIIIRIVNLRLEIARFLDLDNFAEMILGDRMADTQTKVEKFLEELYEASKPAAIRDFENIRNLLGRCGHTGSLERWDWAYYSEKLKKKLFDIDDEILKPYFSLENAEKAIFDLASSLYGIRFIQNNINPGLSPGSKDIRGI